MQVRCACPFRDCGLYIDLDDELNTEEDITECVGCGAKVSCNCANRETFDSRSTDEKQTICVTCAPRRYKKYITMHMIDTHNINFCMKADPYEI